MVAQELDAVQGGGQVTVKKAARPQEELRTRTKRHSGRTGNGQYSTDWEQGTVWGGAILGCSFGLMLFLGVMFGW